MFHELGLECFRIAQPLFAELSAYHLFCAGVLAGKYPGRVFVDNLTQPHTALVMKDEMWVYLGGDPGNNAFNEALHTGFWEKRIVGEHAAGLLISFAPGGWLEALADLFTNRPLVEMPRRHYVARAMTTGAVALPDGFTLHFIDAALGEQAGKSLPDEVQQVLDWRARAGDPDRTAFGYVALHGSTYAAHAVIDCIVGDAGDIGLVTVEAFQRRGLATATSAAAINYGLTHGLTKVCWGCATYNIGSVRTAEKLGLQFDFEHSMYLVVFDETGHLINLAWSQLDAGRFHDALDVCNRLVREKSSPPSVCYFLSGAAWAGLGDMEQAMNCLDTAADQGWDGLSDARNCPALASLHGTPKWETWLARIKANTSPTTVTAQSAQ